MGNGGISVTPRTGTLSTSIGCRTCGGILSLHCKGAFQYSETLLHLAGSGALHAAIRVLVFGQLPNLSALISFFLVVYRRSCQPVRLVHRAIVIFAGLLIHVRSHVRMKKRMDIPRGSLRNGIQLRVL